jgi:HSP90 family molecular chaperone
LLLPVQAEETSEALKPLTDFLKQTLGERVEKVAVSQRLTDSPCALVTSQFGWSAYQERVMRSQVRRLARFLAYLIERPFLSSNPQVYVKCLSPKSISIRYPGPDFWVSTKLCRCT